MANPLLFNSYGQVQSRLLDDYKALVYLIMYRVQHLYLDNISHQQEMVLNASCLGSNKNYRYLFYNCKANGPTWIAVDIFGADKCIQYYDHCI